MPRLFKPRAVDEFPTSWMRNHNTHDGLLNTAPQETRLSAARTAKQPEDRQQTADSRQQTTDSRSGLCAGLRRRTSHVPREQVNLRTNGGIFCRRAKREQNMSPAEPAVRRGGSSGPPPTPTSTRRDTDIDTESE